MKKAAILLWMGGVVMILSVGMTSSVGAVERLKQTIHPLECTAEQVQNGSGSVSSLRPEECDELLTPSEEAALRAQLCPDGTVTLADGSCYAQNGVLSGGGFSTSNASSQSSTGEQEAAGDNPVNIQSTRDASIANTAKKICSACLSWWWVILLLIASNLLTGWLIWGLAARRRKKRQDD